MTAAVRPYSRRSHWQIVVAMALHELATNAVKYGALSNGGGRVTIAWERSQTNRVKLVWQESGRSEGLSPKAKRLRVAHLLLIERAFAGELGGSELVFSPQGLACTLEVAL